MTPAQEPVLPFDDALKTCGLFPLTADGVSILQVNVGRLCNQSCKHCHVDAGPGRREMMSDGVMEKVLGLLARESFNAVDLTGGAPELHPRFREFVSRAVSMGRSVIDRCNLTVLLEPGMEDLPAFFVRHRVAVYASLPYYRREETDAVRGRGTFDKSVRALELLNAQGYGMEGTGLELYLVHNPAGAFFPAPQASLEEQFKVELEKKHRVFFNRLFTITNMPIARFDAFLQKSGNRAAYLTRLAGAFNPAAAKGVMCRNMISVSWDGYLYDCDFNQMAGLKVNHGAPNRLDDWNRNLLERREIMTGVHCYGCTAGSGSSCGGETAP